MVKRTVNSNEASVKKAKVSTIEVHPSQCALAKRAFKATTDGAVIVVADTGYGKSRVMSLMAKQYSKDKDRCLTVFICNSAAHAHELGRDIGAQFAAPYGVGQAESISKHLDEGEVQITMTANMWFNVMLAGNYKTQPQLTRLIRETGTKTLHVIIDEIDSHSNKRKFLMAELHKEKHLGFNLVVSGFSATAQDSPKVEDQNKRGKQRQPPMKHMLGATPQLVKYTPEEKAAFAKDLIPQAKPPAYTVEKLPHPVTDLGAGGKSKFARLLAQLAKIFVQDKYFTTVNVLRIDKRFGEQGRAAEVYSYKQKMKIMGDIIAIQAHDDGAGYLFQAFNENGRKMKEMMGGELVPIERGRDAVLVCHFVPSGAKKHMALLDTTNPEGVLLHKYVDLSSSVVSTRKRDLAEFNALFKRQATGLTLGFINTASIRQTNDYTKVTGGIAVGPFNLKSLKQFKGRIGHRPCTLEEGDILQDKVALHIDSQWARDVIDNMKRKPVERISQRSGTRPDGYDTALAAAIAKLPAVEERVKLNAAMLLRLDNSKLLGDTNMAMAYLRMLVGPKLEAEDFNEKYNDTQDALDDEEEAARMGMDDEEEGEASEAEENATE